MSWQSVQHSPGQAMGSRRYLTIIQGEEPLGTAHQEDLWFPSLRHGDNRSNHVPSLRDDGREIDMIEGWDDGVLQGMA